MITRRRVVAGLGAAAFTSSALSFAQQQSVSPARIGFLPLGSPSNSYDRSLVDAFRQGLREVGLIENRHITVEVVWLRGESEYTAAVEELVKRGVNILIPAGTSASVAARRQT